MQPMPVELVPVGEQVLAELVAAATTDAAPDEVTPPAGAAPGWSAERVAWLTSFHRDRREGLAGPAEEATWAVVAGGRVVGQVRLRRTAEPGTYETGIWLTRSARGSGVGGLATAAVVAHARAAGARALLADTSSANAPALGVLRRLGFALGPPGADGRVAARLDLQPAP